MIDVKDDKRQQNLSLAIDVAIGARIKNDDIDASARAQAFLTKACIEIAHINDDVGREEILDRLPDMVRKMVSGTRALIVTPPKHH